MAKFFNKKSYSHETESQYLHGIHAVREAMIKKTRPVEKVFFDKDKVESQAFSFLKECKKQKIPYQVIASQKINFMANKAVHQGVIALCGVKHYVSIDSILSIARQDKKPPVLLVADAVEDPRNLGALIRTSLAAGVNGIILPDHGGVGLTPAVAKSATGALESMPVARIHDIASTLKKLSKDGFDIVGLDCYGTHQYWDGTFPGPLVIIVGGEDKGIRPHIKRCCTSLYSIPINRACHSLNLSVAAGIFLFEIIRQRKNRNPVVSTSMNPNPIFVKNKAPGI